MMLNITYSKLAFNMKFFQEYTMLFKNLKWEHYGLVYYYIDQETKMSTWCETKVHLHTCTYRWKTKVGQRLNLSHAIRERHAHFSLFCYSCDLTASDSIRILASTLFSKCCHFHSFVLCPPFAAFFHKQIKRKATMFFYFYFHFCHCW